MATKKKAAKKAATRKAVSPREARTNRAIIALPRTTVDVGGFWFLVEEGDVTIAQQKNGEPAKAMITMPRGVFNRFVDFYHKPQPTAVEGR